MSDQCERSLGCEAEECRWPDCVPMSERKIVRTAPERIYLQIGEDQPLWDEHFDDGEEVTWCADSIGGVEIPYVRADAAEARAERYRKALEAVIKEMDEGRIVSASGDYIQSRGPWVVAEAARAALRGEG